MASLLVRVERSVLDAIRGRASSGQTQLRRDELPQPELSYLDPESVAFVVWLDGATLRCGMTVHEPVLDRGKLIGGDVLLHDHELTPILARLGTDTRGVAAWSATPRVLPPNDVDLLRYELGLPLDARRNLVLEATLVAPEDEADRELLAEIWANPASDTPRMIYADRLQQRADPRGELISLQLARGDGGRTTERERELVTKWGRTCTRPLTPFLAFAQLRRGFLAHAMVDDRQPFPQALLEHPMWALVEELQTAHRALLRAAPLGSLRVLRTTGATLSNLTRTFPHVAWLLGNELPPPQGYRGIALADLAAWQRLGTAAATWPGLRAISVDPVALDPAVLLGIILRSPLGHQLAHLDLTVEPYDPLDPHQLFAELARSPTIQRVALLAQLETSVPEPLAVIYDRQPSGAFALTLQLPPLSRAPLLHALTWIVPLTRGIEHVTVTYVSIRGRTHDLAAEQLLVAGLRREVTSVIVLDELRHPICPWAYPRAPHVAALPSTFRL